MSLLSPTAKATALRQKLIVPPDSLFAACLLAFLATSGINYTAIMPVFVTGLERVLHFSPQQAGFIVSANIYGAALGALTAALIGPRLPWRSTAWIALTLLIASDLLSLRVQSLEGLITLRSVNGMCGGILAGIGFSVISRTHVPDRSFGMLLLVQSGITGLGVIILPNLLQTLGLKPVFLFLVALEVLSLLSLPFLSAYPAPPAAQPGTTDRKRRQWFLLGAIFVGLFLYQAARNALGAHAFGVGEELGQSQLYLSTLLGLTSWTGALGAILVVGIGVRFGRFWPILAAMVLEAACYLLIATWGHHPWAWVIGLFAGSVTAPFALPYLSGMAARLDPTGRAVIFGSFCSKLGMATGPTLGGAVVTHLPYVNLLWLAAAGAVAFAIFVGWPARLLDQNVAEDPMPPTPISGSPAVALQP